MMVGHNYGCLPSCSGPGRDADDDQSAAPAAVRGLRSPRGCADRAVSVGRRVRPAHRAGGCLRVPDPLRQGALRGAADRRATAAGRGHRPESGAPAGGRRRDLPLRQPGAVPAQAGARDQRHQRRRARRAGAERAPAAAGRSHRRAAASGGRRARGAARVPWRLRGLLHRHRERPPRDRGEGGGPVDGEAVTHRGRAARVVARPVRRRRARPCPRSRFPWRAGGGACGRGWCRRSARWRRRCRRRRRTRSAGRRRRSARRRNPARRGS